MADSFLLPHLLFFTLTPEGAAMLARAPAVAGWIARMQARASYGTSPMKTALAMFDRYAAPSGELLWAAE